MFPALLKEKNIMGTAQTFRGHMEHKMLFGLDQVYMTRTFTCSNVLQKTYFTVMSTVKQAGTWTEFEGTYTGSQCSRNL